MKLSKRLKITAYSDPDNKTMNINFLRKLEIRKQNKTNGNCRTKKTINIIKNQESGFNRKGDTAEKISTPKCRYKKLSYES